MTCENCQWLQSRVDELELAASHVATQQRANRINRLLTGAGLDPTNAEQVSPPFLRACFYLIDNNDAALDCLIADRIVLMKTVRAKRANQLAAAQRIDSDFFPHDGDTGADHD